MVQTRSQNQHHQGKKRGVSYRERLSSLSEDSHCNGNGSTNKSPAKKRRRQLDAPVPDSSLLHPIDSSKRSSKRTISTSSSDSRGDCGTKSKQDNNPHWTRSSTSTSSSFSSSMTAPVPESESYTVIDINSDTDTDIEIEIETGDQDGIQNKKSGPTSPTKASPSISLPLVRLSPSPSSTNEKKTLENKPSSDSSSSSSKIIQNLKDCSGVCSNVDDTVIDSDGINITDVANSPSVTKESDAIGDNKSFEMHSKFEAVTRNPDQRSVKPKGQKYLLQSSALNASTKATVETKTEITENKTETYESTANAELETEVQIDVESVSDPEPETETETESKTRKNFLNNDDDYICVDDDDDDNIDTQSSTSSEVEVVNLIVSESDSEYVDTDSDRELNEVDVGTDTQVMVHDNPNRCDNDNDNSSTNNIGSIVNNDNNDVICYAQDAGENLEDIQAVSENPSVEIQFESGTNLESESEANSETLLVVTEETSNNSNTNPDPEAMDTNDIEMESSTETFLAEDEVRSFKMMSDIASAETGETGNTINDGITMETNNNDLEVELDSEVQESSITSQNPEVEEAEAEPIIITVTIILAPEFQSEYETPSVSNGDIDMEIFAIDIENSAQTEPEGGVDAKLNGILMEYEEISGLESKEEHHVQTESKSGSKALMENGSENESKMSNSIDMEEMPKVGAQSDAILDNEIEMETGTENEIENEAQNEIENEAQNEIEIEAQNEIENEAQNEIENEAQNEIENQAQYEIENEAQNEIENEAQNEIENEAENEIDAEKGVQKTVESKCNNEINNDFALPTPTPFAISESNSTSERVSTRSEINDASLPLESSETSDILNFPVPSPETEIEINQNFNFSSAAQSPEVPIATDVQVESTMSPLSNSQLIICAPDDSQSESEPIPVSVSYLVFSPEVPGPMPMTVPVPILSPIVPVLSQESEEKDAVTVTNVVGYENSSSQLLSTVSSPSPSSTSTREIPIINKIKTTNSADNSPESTNPKEISSSAAAVVSGTSTPQKSKSSKSKSKWKTSKKFKSNPSSPVYTCPKCVCKSYQLLHFYKTHLARCCPELAPDGLPLTTKEKRTQNFILSPGYFDNDKDFNKKLTKDSGTIGFSPSTTLDQESMSTSVSLVSPGPPTPLLAVDVDVDDSVDVDTKAVLPLKIESTSYEDIQSHDLILKMDHDDKGNEKNFTKLFLKSKGKIKTDNKTESVDSTFSNSVSGIGEANPPTLKPFHAIELTPKNPICKKMTQKPRILSKSRLNSGNKSEPGPGLNSKVKPCVSSPVGICKGGEKISKISMGEKSVTKHKVTSSASSKETGKKHKQIEKGPAPKQSTVSKLVIKFNQARRLERAQIGPKSSDENDNNVNVDVDISRKKSKKSKSKKQKNDGKQVQKMKIHFKRSKSVHMRYKILKQDPIQGRKHKQSSTTTAIMASTTAASTNLALPSKSKMDISGKSKSKINQDCKKDKAKAKTGGSGNFDRYSDSAFPLPSNYLEKRKLHLEKEIILLGQSDSREVQLIKSSGKKLFQDKVKASPEVIEIELDENDNENDIVEVVDLDMDTDEKDNVMPDEDEDIENELEMESDVFEEDVFDDEEATVKAMIRSTLKETVEKRISCEVQTKIIESDCGIEDGSGFGEGTTSGSMFFYTPKYLAENIEKELTAFYGRAASKECVAQFKKINYLLSDLESDLFRHAMYGQILPKDLAKLPLSDYSRDGQYQPSAASGSSTISVPAPTEDHAYSLTDANMSLNILPSYSSRTRSTSTKSVANSNVCKSAAKKNRIEALNPAAKIAKNVETEDNGLTVPKVLIKFSHVSSKANAKANSIEVPNSDVQFQNEIQFQRSLADKEINDTLETLNRLGQKSKNMVPIPSKGKRKTKAKVNNKNKTKVNAQPSQIEDNKPAIVQIESRTKQTLKISYEPVTFQAEYPDETPEDNLAYILNSLELNQPTGMFYKDRNQIQQNLGRRFGNGQGYELGSPDTANSGELFSILENTSLQDLGNHWLGDDIWCGVAQYAFEDIRGFSDD